MSFGVRCSRTGCRNQTDTKVPTLKVWSSFEKRFNPVVLQFRGLFTCFACREKAQISDLVTDDLLKIAAQIRMRQQLPLLNWDTAEISWKEWQGGQP